MQNHATPLRLALDRLNSAEDSYKECLDAHYGKENADEARYQRTHADPIVAAAQDAFLNASRAWNDLVQTHRQQAANDCVSPVATEVKKDTLSELRAAYEHASAADQYFSECLIQYYGEKKAGDARYLTHHEDETVSVAAKRFLDAGMEWQRKADAHRAATSSINLHDLAIDDNLLASPSNLEPTSSIQR